MASKIPPPDQKITRESARAAQAAKLLEQEREKKRAAGTAAGKKRVLDARRAPTSYSESEIIEMVEGGELAVQFNEESIVKFAVGEMTWAQLTGLTAQDAYAFAEVAYNLFEQGKYDQAQTIVEGLVIANPYDAYFHSLLGSVYGRKGMNEEAYEEYSIALELDAKSLATWVNRAELSLQTGSIDNALGDLREAIRLDPHGDTPFGVRARALAQATATILQEAMLQKGIDPDAIARKGSKETDKVGTNQRGYQAKSKGPAPAGTKRK